MEEEQLQWLVKKGHWLMLLLLRISFIKDVVVSTLVSVKILSGLCFLTALFVVVVIEKNKQLKKN